MTPVNSYYTHSFRFIFNDGSISGTCQDDLIDIEWQEKRIPEGSIIKRYELMQNQTNSCLHGIKFLDKRGKVLLAAGDIDNEQARSSILLKTKEYVIRDDEKLIGIKSGSRKFKDFRHYDF